MFAAELRVKNAVMPRILQAAQNEIVRILARSDEHDERVGDERDEEHATHQHRDKMTIGDEDLGTILRNCHVHQAQNADGSEADDPTDHLRNSIGNRGEHIFRMLARGTQRNAQHHTPRQDAPGNSHS